MADSFTLVRVGPAAIPAETIHELWGCGYTIAKRHPDPFHIDPKLIPLGRSYQWNETVGNGWTAVPYSRHEGVFAPWGTKGDIEVGGLHLVERDQEITRRANEQSEIKARKQVADWAENAAALGISGSVTIAGQTVLGKLDGQTEITVGDTFERPTTKTIETTVCVPPDMFPYLDRVFAERDRLEADVVLPDRNLKPGEIADKFYAAIDADKGAPWWPTLRAILLPIAVENVRKTLKEKP